MTLHFDRGAINTYTILRVEVSATDTTLVDITGRKALMRVFDPTTKDTVAETPGTVTCTKEGDVVTKAEIRFPFAASAFINKTVPNLAFAAYQWKPDGPEGALTGPYPLDEGLIVLDLWPNTVPTAPED